MKDSEIETCAHTGRPVVRQRSQDDCMACVLAMFAGRSYEDVVAAAQAISPGYLAGAAMSHSMLRRLAHGWGLALLSSIYMDWRHPGIVAVVSRTLENCGHALFWDGERLIDPAGTENYDLTYVHAQALEFTQRAGDLSAVIQLEREMAPATELASPDEFF